MQRVLVPLADGVEEMEATIVVDMLRRVPWHVLTAGLKPGVVTAARGTRLMPDNVWDKIDPGLFDMIVIPGGARGVEALRRDPRVVDAVRAHAGRGKLTAAVCAGPLVLQDAGLLVGRRATCHPGQVADFTQAQRLDEPVVVDGNVVTSQGAGTTFAFALTLVALVEGEDKARELAQAIVLAPEELGRLGRKK
ncbi:MAG: DJ-1/PfpI family protein [Verrucomicrobia bacterium]|nr:MAG: DJ-1/PfpI family protein [Verrucomicrobiota bacterium]